MSGTPGLDLAEASSTPNSQLRQLKFSSYIRHPLGRGHDCPKQGSQHSSMAPRTKEQKAEPLTTVLDP